MPASSDSVWMITTGIPTRQTEKSRKTSIKDKLVEKKKAADARTVAVEKNVKKKSEEIR